MKDQETNRLKAQEFENSAQKKLRGGCNGVSSCKLEEAASDYEKAANYYKLAKLHTDSAKASILAAEIYQELDQNYSAASQFAKASKSYKMADNRKLAEHYIKLAIEIWSQDGKFSMAAKAMKDLAEDFERDGDYGQAAIMYQHAAEFYENADSPSSSSSSLVLSADCLAQSREFGKASALFESLASSCLKRELGKYRFDEYQLKAVLCKLAEGDAVGAKKLCNAFSKQTSQSCHIKSLLMNLIEAVETNDSDEFAFLGADRLFTSPWHKFVLSEARKQIAKDDAFDLT